MDPLTRLLPTLALAAALAGCDAKKPPPPAAASSAPSAAAPAPGASITPEITSVEGDDSFRLHVFSVPLAGARLRVVDAAMGRDLAGIRDRTGATLVVNGGFFDAGRRPEGLVVSEGATISPYKEALGGGVLIIAGGRGELLAAEGYQAPAGLDFAIQARPRLVVDQATNVKDDGKAAERTALCLRDQGRTLEVVVARGEKDGTGPTLALLADMLVSRGCSMALNLDGGPSTGVAWRGPGEASELAPRGPVRHAVAIWAP